MTYPAPPAIDTPRWAYSGGVYTEPSLDKRQVGWQAVPGQNYGEIPPYQWFNWLQFSTGEWINYSKQMFGLLSNGMIYRKIIQARRDLTNISITTSTPINVKFPDNIFKNFTDSNPYNSTTGVFTAPITSIYEFEYNFQFSPDSTDGARLVCVLQTLNLPYTQSWVVMYSMSYSNVIAKMVIPMEAGQTTNLTISTNSTIEITTAIESSVRFLTSFVTISWPEY